MDVEYKLVPEGTGAMVDKLERGELDIALTVTDGCMVSKAKGRKIDIVGTFVESPLIWAVIGSPQQRHSSIDCLSPIALQRPLKFGISRLGKNCSFYFLSPINVRLLLYQIDFGFV